MFSGTNRNTLQAAKDLVSLKLQIDEKGRTSPSDIPSDLHGPCSGGEYGPLFGDGFLHNIIPFYEYLESSKKSINVMNVPTLQTMGSSWRIWPDPNISEEDKTNILERLCSDVEIKQTHYTHIPELNLFIAHEGKNRVNFFRFHNIEYIPARVALEHYPAPERITVHTLEFAGQQDVWAVLDEQYAQKINYFSYALPLLRAYGVKITDRWPEHFPDIIELIAYSTNTIQSKISNSHSIDLNDIQKKKKQKKDTYERSEAYINCNYIELDTNYRLLSFVKLYIFLVILFIISFCLLLNINSEFFEKFCISLLSFISAIFFFITAPIIRCKRKNLRDK